MNIQFKKGVLEMCILSAICSRDYYGYEIVKYITSSIKVSKATIYLTLRELVLNGYLKTYFSNSDEIKKYYSITSKGKEATIKLINEWYDLTGRINNIIKEVD